MPQNDTSWAAIRDALPACWRSAIGAEFDEPYMGGLETFVAGERAMGKPVYPADSHIFAALVRTPLSSVKAVILGQDPYYKPGQAVGLSFSVPRDVKLPKTLRNIYKEMEADIGIPGPGHGDLTTWTSQGVLLLNAFLSVEGEKPGSHRRRGWHRFTDRVLQAVNARPGHAAFILWGEDAKAKAPLVDASRHLLHVSAHPSPLGAYRGFWNSRPFSRVNAFLEERGIAPIDWRLDRGP